MRICDDIAANVAIDPETGCHVWLRSKTHDGYAHMASDGKVVYVHRWVWEREHGPLPEGFHVDHLCFNSSCIRLDHLRALDGLENARRQRSALATHCQRGHEFTPENTYRRRDTNRRQCRTCKSMRQQTRRAAA